MRKGFFHESPKRKLILKEHFVYKDTKQRQYLNHVYVLPSKYDKQTPEGF